MQQIIVLNILCSRADTWYDIYNTDVILYSFEREFKKKLFVSFVQIKFWEHTVWNDNGGNDLGVHKSQFVDKWSVKEICGDGQIIP